MYARVAELADARAGMRAIDLFAGVGGIGLALARAGAEVIAVELDREAVGQLRRAAERAGLPLTAIAGDAVRFRAKRSASRTWSSSTRRARGCRNRRVRCSPHSHRRRSSTSAAAPRRSAATSSRSRRTRQMSSSRSI